MLIQSIVHCMRKSRPHIRVIAISNSLDQQVPQGTIVESHFSKYVKNFASKCFALLFQLFKQTMKHHAFPGFHSNKIP